MIHLILDDEEVPKKIFVKYVFSSNLSREEKQKKKALSDLIAQSKIAGFNEISMEKSIEGGIEDGYNLVKSIYTANDE